MERPEDVDGAIDDAWAHDGPVVIDFRVEREANVFPIVPAGKSIGEMMVDSHGIGMTRSRTTVAATRSWRYCRIIPACCIAR